jgi:hypothetical protein
MNLSTYHLRPGECAIFDAYDRKAVTLNQKGKWIKAQNIDRIEAVLLDTWTKPLAVKCDKFSELIVVTNGSRIGFVGMLQ